MRPLRRPRAVTAGLLAGALLLSGCSAVSDLGDQVTGRTATPLPSDSGSPPTGSEDLARFYDQKLAWSDCGPGQCTELTVPRDYADPTGATTTVTVLKVPARRKNQRLGSLVVNPGGPGGSGVQYAAAADSIVGGPVRDRFDIVGFDPRGVGYSHPIDCVGDAALDRFLGADPTPDGPAGERDFARTSRAFATACGANAGPLLGHVSTADVAKDMDVLRAALGEAKLNYLGKSYGTFLGATYAGLFPDKVGRFVLDGVVPPDLTDQEVNLGQAKGFELATRTWAEHCVSGGDCPLGGSVDEVMSGMRALLTRLDRSPAKVSDPRITGLNEAWASLGIAQAMYDQRLWDTLTAALRSLVRDNDGQPLLRLADQYANRTPKGAYRDNLMEVIYAVNCLDKPASSRLADYEAAARTATEAAPTWGPFLAWSSLACGYWPVKATAKPAPVAAEGSDPIVVIGTTRDPATPYEWSVRLNDELSNSALITYDGDGHTAYTRSNACVDDAVDTYYTRGTVPKDGLRC